MNCHQPEHGWVPKGTGEDLAHEGEGTVKQSVCSVKAGEERRVLKPVMARGRPSWKGRIWRLKEISCAEDHKKEPVQKESAVLFV